MMFCLNNLSYFRLAQIPSSMPLDLTLSIFLFWCHDIQTKCGKVHHHENESWGTCETEYGECATCRRTSCHQAHFSKINNLNVSFLSHSSIKIVSQQKLILRSLSPKLVSGFFQWLVLWQTPNFHLSAMLTLSHTLSLCLSSCLPVSPSFRSCIKIMQVCILDY